MRIRPFELLLQLTFLELKYSRIPMGSVKKPINVVFKIYLFKNLLIFCLGLKAEVTEVLGAVSEDVFSLADSC